MGLRQAVQELKSKYNQEELPEFEVQRRRLQQQLAEQRQQRSEELERGLSRSGGGPAGARIKLGQQLEEDIGRQRQSGEEQLSAQELAIRRQLSEAEKQRQFAVSEREAGQKFASGENLAQREFARGERLSGQQFAGGENLAQREFAQKEALGQREFARGERLGAETFQKGLSDLDQAFRQKIFEFDKSSKLQELDLAKQSFALEQDVAQFNKQIAAMEANKPTDLMGSLFGPQFSTSSSTPLGRGANIAFGGPVLQTAGKLFCFLENTLVDLDENTKIRVQDIKLGDHIYEGGEIYFLGSAYASPDEIYYYHGVLVTGSHAVMEDGEWVRVEKSKDAKQVKFLEPQKVYFLSNEYHRIIVNGITFSDFDEVDDGHLFSEEECLLKLNEQLKKE